MDEGAPAGWSRDEADAAEMRWWDGRRFTGARRSAQDSAAVVRDAPVTPVTERVDYRLPNADGAPSVDALAEAERIEEIADLIGRTLEQGEIDERTLEVDLIPEPDHPTGLDAVSVRAGGRVLGYLPNASAHRAALDRVVASGAVPVTTARLRVERGEEGLRAVLRVALVAPELLVPLNEPPVERHSILPWSRGLPVLREDEHFARLSTVVPASGRGLLLVTLHPAGDLVELRLDGERVGELSPTLSADFTPTLRHLASLGLTAAAYASLRGSPLKVELTLQAAKAAELPAEWVDGRPVTLPRLLPRARTYTVPPAYTPPLRPTPRSSEAVSRSVRRTVAWVVVGVCTLVGLSSWLIGDVLN
ncbi:hypothetical protein [Rathayibacter sp. AY1A3]|uniref:hypothetical protein n=1 Tax=Rathayibacter sp. AY1A3 TaxID=2080521 RepID=UPI000CE902C4|nr:hypothetical protein [Rathayibacter sp. AY1A3]PPF40792.1 hypothetical protein C5C10_01075 [Rathayibacter sp. AY1A3]